MSDDVPVPRLTPLDRRVLKRAPAADAEPVEAAATFRAPDVRTCPTDFRRYARGADAGCQVCASVLEEIADARPAPARLRSGVMACRRDIRRARRWRRRTADGYDGFPTSLGP